jgi:hypothetical protein
MTEQQYYKEKCIGCGSPRLTWAEQRRQYGRAIRRGLTPDEAKRLMPRCQKCLTVMLGDDRHRNARKKLYEVT